MNTFTYERKENTKIGTTYINDTLSEIFIILHGNKDGLILNHNEPYQVITETQVQEMLFQAAPWYSQMIGCCFPKSVKNTIREIVVIGDWNETTHITGTLTNSGTLNIIPTTERRSQIASQLRARIV